MRKSALRLTSVALAAGFAGISLFSAGCGNPQEQADSVVAAKVAQADKDRDTAATDSTKLKTVQGQYDAAATSAITNTTVSLPMRVLTQAREAQLRYQRALRMMADLRSQELKIAGHIAAINRLASQIQGSQTYVDSLKSYDPAKQITDLQATADKIKGPDASYVQSIKDAENPDAKITIPTVDKLKSDIDELTANIAKTKAAIEALHKQSADAMDQNETLARKLESETGNALVDDSTQAAKLRQNAADFDAQAETLAAAQARMEAELATDQSQKEAVDGTSDTVLSQIKRLQDAWGIIQGQIDSEQKFQQKLIAGASGDAKQPASIVSIAVDLASDLTACDALRVNVDKELSSAISQFKAAASDANKVYTEVQNLIVTKPEDADVPVWKQELETMYPGNFTILQATAMGSQAVVRANNAAIHKQMQLMFNGYPANSEKAADWIKAQKLNIDTTTPLPAIEGLNALLASDKTGIAIPKEVSALPCLNEDQFHAEVSDVNKAFSECLEVFTPGGVDLTSASKERRAAGMAGKALTDREWAEFCMQIDAPAREVQGHLDAAVQADGEAGTTTEAAVPVRNVATTRPYGQ